MARVVSRGFKTVNEKKLTYSPKNYDRSTSHAQLRTGWRNALVSVIAPCGSRAGEWRLHFAVVSGVMKTGMEQLQMFGEVLGTCQKSLTDPSRL